MGAELLSEREFPYSPRDFQRARGLIHEHAGIAIGEGKSEMVYSRLAKRLRVLGIPTFADYLRLLDDPRHAEWEHFVNALTTNQTEFFREAHHFPTLAAHVRGIRGRTIRIWSAAAATGEEAYSIAITACEAFETLSPPGPDPRHGPGHARASRKARDGHLQPRKGSGARPRAATPVLPQGTQRAVRLRAVRDELRETIRFRTLNLRDAHWDVDGPFDADLLPQRAHLFRQADAAARCSSGCTRASPRRHLLRGAFGKPAAGRRPLRAVRAHRLPPREAPWLSPPGRQGERDESSGVSRPAHYVDRHFQLPAAKIGPGEVYATQRDMLIVTVLGSCVSACLRDPDSRVGG
jgi:chemotaxis protein methyltransferase CheR